MPQVSLEQLVVGAVAGKLVSFPTDTVPALAALPECADLIYTAKQRSQDKPLILMAAIASDLWDFVQGTQAELSLWQQVADEYFPGALTLVLPASSRVPPSMNPLDPTTIGIRVPNSAIARKILTATTPLATTSANLSGQPALLRIPEITTQFPDVLTLSEVECASEKPGGQPSTVVKWTGRDWQVLRQGAVLFPY
ncbi:L-threonylcarbamoyladenylate synthase [Calothrix sp. 336/3]|uniref:L-threonylcarbamoyladenylate synthase n=1 Tax=Calothrix sp. 336/3 TaxID=1337936 RepID=UPI0004E2B4B0|nr:L-threonylcarbamoyladenylate synthase [Calothrix sp. 336/3]AKG23531.1 hypothetical protein IJ00_21625 [Calothrix sp. 336/3]